MQKALNQMPRYSFDRRQGKKSVIESAHTQTHTHTHTRGAQVPTEINESMNGTAGEMEDTERETMHWHSNQVKRKNVDFTLTRT